MSRARTGGGRARGLDMPEEQWRRMEELLPAALELPAAARGAFLGRRCSPGSALRAELDALLAAHDAAGPLDRPVVWPGGRASAPRGDRAEPVAGAVVSHYEVQERLGRGGTGVVHRARDLRLDRTVALKFLDVTAVDDACARRRFLTEARAAGALEHANVCTVHEIDETPDGRPFIAMAFVDGPTVRTLVRRGPLPVAQAVEVACQIAAALACAHARGIVHRDVKPANVMVDSDGVAKLVDFGVAMLAGRTPAEARARLGTVAYMAPEQARGEEIDHRADVWGLGAVLYEMLAGRRPFVGDTYATVLRRVTTEDPAPLRTRRPEVAAELERVVARALEKARDRRFQSAGEMRDALRRLAAPPAPAGAHGGGARPLARLVGPVLLAVGVPILGIAAARTARRRPRPRRRRWVS